MNKIKKAEILLSRIQDYYLLMQRSKKPEEEYSFEVLETLVNDGNALGENPFIEISKGEKTTVFYDYQTGVSFSCINIDGYYQVIKEAYTQVDYYKEVVARNLGLVMEIFAKETGRINDPILSLALHEEACDLKQDIEKDKKLLLGKITTN